MRRAALGFVLALLAPGLTFGAQPEPRVAVLVFGRGVSENIAVRVERDLRNMFDYAHGEGGKAPQTLAIEPRFDVGHLSKGELGKSRRHFNEAQRALENGDADEALDQLFRAERFYNKAIPFAADTSLLSGIFYYYYLARQAAKQGQKVVDAYCAYVALTRNLAGSAGPIEQFEPLADKCGETSIAGTAELKVRSNVDGAHVYVDERPVGVIGRDVPYVNPFISAGPHLIEVRKAGYARWGTLSTLRNGKSQSLRARLKKARNRKAEFEPLSELLYTGEDAFSETYIGDLLFEMAERYGAQELVVGYVDNTRVGGLRLTILSHSEAGLGRFEAHFKDERDGHRAALSKYWAERFGDALDPGDALPRQDSWAPTLFKVE